MRIDFIAFTVEPSEQSFEICKDKDGGMRDNRAIRKHSGEIIIPQRLMKHVKILHKEYNSSIMWIEHEINIPLQNLNWWKKKKNSDADEAEADTDVKKPRKENYKIHWKT